MNCVHNPLVACNPRDNLLLQATHSPARNAVHASQHVMHGIWMLGHAAVRHMVTCSAYAHWGLPAHGSNMRCLRTRQSEQEGLTCTEADRCPSRQPH